jgi:hypothetical protein
MAPIRADNPDLSTGFEYSIEFIKECNTLRAIQMLNKVRAMRFIHRVIFPRPRGVSDIHDMIHPLEWNTIYSLKSGELVLTTTNI